MSRELTPQEKKLMNGNTAQTKMLRIDNIFPTDKGAELPFCPELEPTQIPMADGIIRVYHACVSRCQLYSQTKKDRGLNPCTLSAGE